MKEEVVVDFSVTWWTTHVCTDQCGLKFQASGLLWKKKREAGGVNNLHFIFFNSIRLLCSQHEAEALTDNLWTRLIDRQKHQSQGTLQGGNGGEATSPCPLLSGTTTQPRLASCPSKIPTSVDQSNSTYGGNVSSLCS